MLAPYTEEQILAWADDHHRITGEWPTRYSGPILAAPGKTWKAVQSALRYGHRGFPGGSTLTGLLVEHRGKSVLGYAPPLSIGEVLAWADAFRVRTGRWPTANSGPVAEVPCETWSAIHAALVEGLRGLPGGSSLSRLFAQERSANQARGCRSLTISEILSRADAYHDRHGKWPKDGSGPIPEAPGETWGQVRTALRLGRYGLPGGTTLARLLNQERGVRYYRDLVPFQVERIGVWADAHYMRTGRWPGCRSGEIPGTPNVTWSSVEYALRAGRRGLPGGSSITLFLAETGRTGDLVQPRDATDWGDRLPGTGGDPCNGLESRSTR